MTEPPTDPARPSFPSEERRPMGSDGLEPELIVRELSPTAQPGAIGPAQPPHDPYAALRVRNYRAFASGFIFSSTALGMLSTALAWDIYERTKDPLALGLVGLSRAIPVILLALPAGHLVDICNRKRLLMGSQVSFALIMLALAAISGLTHGSRGSIGLFYLLVVLTGCTRVVNGPTRQSILPLIVPPDVFHSAVTWNSGVFQFSAIVGPVLAGVIIAFTGAAWPVYIAGAVGCAIFAVSSTLIDLPHAAPAGETRFSIRSMFAGLSHVHRDKVILATIALDMLAVLFGGATALLPIYADQYLKVNTTFLGLDNEAVRLGALRAAPFAGAFVMALILAHRRPFERSGRALLISIAGFGIAMVIFGFSRSFWLSIAVLAFAGALDNISVVIRHVLVQTRTPNHLRGRVSAVNSVFIESSNELGAFESGAVARLTTTTFSVVSGGIGTLLVVLGIGLKWPEVRRLKHSSP